MRKKVLVLMCVLLSLTVGGAVAQTVVGAKTGLNLNWYSGSNWDNFIASVEAIDGVPYDEAPAPTFHIGAFIESMFTDNIGIVLELNASSYGQAYSYPTIFGDVDGTFRQSIVEVPVLLKLTGQPLEGFYVLAGASAQYLYTDLELREELLGAEASTTFAPDNDLVFGALIGGGWDIQFGSRGIFKIEGRYTRNITDDFDPALFDVNRFNLLVGLGSASVPHDTTRF